MSLPSLRLKMLLNLSFQPQPRSFFDKRGSAEMLMRISFSIADENVTPRDDIKHLQRKMSITVNWMVVFLWS